MTILVTHGLAHHGLNPGVCISSAIALAWQVITCPMMARGVCPLGGDGWGWLVNLSLNSGRVFGDWRDPLGFRMVKKHLLVHSNGAMRFCPLQQYTPTAGWFPYSCNGELNSWTV